MRRSFLVAVLFFLGCSTASPPASTTAKVTSLAAADSPRAGTSDGNPVYLQSRFGQQGNFELAVPSALGGLDYYWRDNDHDMFWNGPNAVFTDAGHFDALTMIESNYGSPGDMELIAVRGDRLSFMFHDSDPATPWHGPWDIASGVAGVPSLIQSSFGQKGNFEVVVPSATAGLFHFWRDNDNGMVWHGPVNFFANFGRFDAVSIIQSNYAGHFEGLARRGTQLWYFFHDSDWRGPWLLGDGFSGNPVLIQSRFGQKGNFEVAIPMLGGGVATFWRDNDNGMVWHGPDRQFAGFGNVDAVSLFESNYGSPGNLEMLLRQGQSLAFAFRVDAGAWQGPFVLATPTDPPSEPPPALHRGHTQYLGSFTANPVNHETSVGILGVDLGVGFEAANGSLAFLFGDAWTPGHARDNWDSIATTRATAADRAHAPAITWAQSGGGFAPMDLPGVDGGGMNVPLDGVALGGENYVFTNSGWHGYCDNCPGAHGTLALGVMPATDPSAVTTLFSVASQRFTNVAVVPGGDGFVYLFGAGEPYRMSPVYLARFTPSDIGNFSAWQFFRGTRGGAPAFGPGELTAVPLFAGGANWSGTITPLTARPPNGGVGEMSVREALGLYLMTYNSALSDGRRGIFLRTSPTPWGPWSAPELLIDAGEAYWRWQHVSPVDNGVVVRPDDGLGEYARRDEWGGEYGPYLVPRWFTDEGNGAIGLTYTLSSWNPYQAHLIRSVVTRDGHAVSPPAYGAGWPRATLVNGDWASGDTRGWTQLGDDFAVFIGSDGKRRLTTYGAKGDATVGQLYQDVSLDAQTTQLAFKIHGGAAQVKLVRNDTGETVRAVHARNDNAHELEVCWDLRDLQGLSVRVLVEDQVTTPWGFIGVGALRLLDATQDCRDPNAALWQ
jgi:hypothetical protein